MTARCFNVWRRVSLRLALLLCLLSACNAVVPAETPEATPGATARAVVRASDTPAPRPTRASTITPYVWPTLPPSPTPVCPDAPRTRLIVQERGRVLPDDPRPVNVRREPGTDQPVQALLPVLTVFYVVDGPVCRNGYSWFQIQHNGVEGWIAEGDLTSYYVEPYLPG